ILLPSGDHTGFSVVVKTVSLVNGATPDPSAFMTQRLVMLFGLSLPSKARVYSKAILLPSGDHSGKTLLAFLLISLVSGAAPDPSAFIIQIFEVEALFAASLPSRARDESKAILLPSGDHTASELSAPKAVSLVSGVTPEPSAFMTQMLNVELVFTASLPSNARRDVNVIFRPSGDQTGPKLSVLVLLKFVSGTALEPCVSQMLVILTDALLPSSARVDSKAIGARIVKARAPDVRPPGEGLKTVTPA